MKLKKTLILPLICVFFFQTAFADTASHKTKEEKQKTEKQQKTRKKKPFFKALGSDIGRIFTSPLRMKGKDFLIWGGVAAITGLLIANDEKIYADFKTFQSKHDWVDKISPQITKLGEGYASLGLAGAFYLGGVVLKDKKAKETARLTLMTFIHTGLVVQVGKHIFGRQRPSWDPGKDGWNWFEGFTKRYKKYQISHYDAFPSGHTISAFGTATVIATMYKKTVWVPVLSYSLATLCGLSRITEDTHWLSDVFLGAVLGYAIGKFVVKRRNCISKLNIYPIVTTKQVSLNVSYAL